MCHIPKYCAREIISLNLDFMANFIACNSCIATAKHFCLHNPSDSVVCEYIKSECINS